MSHRNPPGPRRPWGPALVLLAAAFVPGCGADDGLGKRLPVSGTVTYKGQPLARGNISFVPEDPEAGRPASGIIESGSYRMTTITPDDGVIPGKYRVTVASLEEVDLSDAQKAAGGGGVVDQAVVAKISRKAKSLIPKKYGDPNGSGLTAEVPGSSYDFNLAE